MAASFTEGCPWRTVQNFSNHTSAEGRRFASIKGPGKANAFNHLLPAELGEIGQNKFPRKKSGNRWRRQVPQKTLGNLLVIADATGVNVGSKKKRKRKKEISTNHTGGAI